MKVIFVELYFSILWKSLGRWDSSSAKYLLNLILTIKRTIIFPSAISKHWQDLRNHIIGSDNQWTDPMSPSINVTFQYPSPSMERRYTIKLLSDRTIKIWQTGRLWQDFSSLPMSVAYTNERKQMIIIFSYNLMNIKDAFRETHS